MPGKYPTDQALREELIAFRLERKLTREKLSDLLGISGATYTFLSKYLNDNLDRELPGFEERCRDVLKGIKERIAFGTRIFDSSVTTRVGHAFNLIRKTGQIGFVTGPAGHGKTSAIQHFISRNPTALFLPLYSGGGSSSKVESAIFSKIDTTSWDGRTSRFEFLVERFKTASRLLIFDNSQRLDSTGRNWLFDFHDAAQNPIGCIGNPEALKPILANDQHSRRLGICTSYELTKEEIPAMAFKVAEQRSDTETAEAIEDLVTVIAMNDGALGAVELSVVLMQQLRELDADLRSNPRKALRAAHSRLARKYLLPSD